MIAAAIARRSEPMLVHTGQHYDDAMSRVFLHRPELTARRLVDVLGGRVWGSR
jgi:UDP-N-acetylglucosamine 2-epimerase